jgi:peptide/nickel transport system substrate-binding protein
MNQLSDLVLPGPSRRGVLRAAGAGSALLALSACQSAVDKNKDKSTSATPKRGGTLTIANPVDFTPSLLFTQSTSLSLPNRLLFNTLTRYDEQLRPQPELARSWKLAKDGKSITLNLRDDVKYHDGRAFTADDVIFAITNLKDPSRASQMRAMASMVTGFHKQGDHTVTLTLAQPLSNLFDLFEFMIIADRNTVGDLLKGKKLNGTGPFRLKSWSPGSALNLTRNDHYWVPGRPYLDAVTIRVIAQSDTLLSSLRTGQSQLSYGLAGSDAATLTKDAKFHLKNYDIGGGSLYIGCDVKARYTKDKRVRQAISWAVDRGRLVQQITGGNALASSAPWPKSSPAYSAAAAAHYTHDPGKARELLKSAGATNITLPMAYAASPGGTAVAQVIQYDLKQVGINVKLQPYSDTATFQKKLVEGGMGGLWTLTHQFAEAQPVTLPLTSYVYNQAHNTSQFSSPEYAKLVQEMLQLTNPDGAQARSLYKQLTDLLLDQQFVVELAVLPTTEVSLTTVHGETMNKFNFLNLDDAYLS